MFSVGITLACGAYGSGCRRPARADGDFVVVNRYYSPEEAKRLFTLLFAGAIVVAACEGPLGPPGPGGGIGERGIPGANGANGANGSDGEVGAPGRSPYFTGPGLKLAIKSFTMNAKGAAVVTFTITDEDGLALDKDSM